MFDSLHTVLFMVEVSNTGTIAFGIMPNLAVFPLGPYIGEA